MVKRKVSFHKWLPGALIFVLLLVGGNIVLFRYLLNKSGGRETLQALSSLSEYQPTVSPELDPVVSVPLFKSKTQKLIAIVIDDIGYSGEIVEQLFRISPKITLAILPYLPDSKNIAQQATKNGQELLLHIPMEPEDRKKLLPPQPGMLLLHTSPYQMLDQIKKQIKSLSSIVGANNHMGSRFTANKEAMGIVLRELKRQKLFFLDSFTSEHSIAYPTAKKLRLPVLRRDVFLDNELNKQYISKQLDQLIQIAKQQGQAIGIAHPHDVTLEVLRESIPKMTKQGIKLVPISHLLN